ncbi:MAG: PQQ-binding-like beta-propeller repeat protein [Planctomycetaceae bacterium]|jgi:outer membrane protein assembly factor BamB|nr:PQQ-binding-like beta-propeller repeat protein [Planctomycetaceae bacterium]
MISRLIFVLTLLFSVLCTSFAEEPNWNQFRGPNHDNKSFSTGIAQSWSEGNPKLLWKIDDLGEGYSNLSFYGNTMFTMGDIGENCFLFALDKTTGKKIWSTLVGKSGSVGRYFGPRSTPAVDGQFVFAYSQFGDFICVDMKTGKEIWGGDVVEQLGGKYMNMWGFASSPIFDGENVLVPVGGEEGTLVAFKKDGKRAWRTKNLKDDAPYSSVVPAEIEGKKQYLLFTLSGLYGIEPSNGDILWRTVRPMERPVCSDPVYKDGVALVSTAYNVGSHGYKITKKDENFVTEEIYADKELQNHHGGIVLVGDYAYFTTNRNLVCLEMKTGKIVWQNRSVGKGSVTYVDGHLIVRSEAGDGTIALVEATPETYKEKGRFNQPNRSDKNSWTYPVIVDGKMYIRDQNVLLCYDLQF